MIGLKQIGEILSRYPEEKPAALNYAKVREDIALLAGAIINAGESSAEQKCRVCGCTWEQACPGGCYWVEEDLCSACADSEE